MNFFKSALILASLLPAVARAQSTGATLPGTQTTVHVPQQPWQERRAAFKKAVIGANAHDPDAVKELNSTIAQFEKEPFARTPVETMDIIGSFYAPKDPIPKTLTVVTMYAVLGWYDALRFGTASGRDEIMNKERLFMRAFLLSGPETSSKFKAFMKDNPDLAKKTITGGLYLADKERKGIHYDVHWPTAYGLEPMICAQGGSCAPPTEMPEDQWDKAWEEAKKRVSAYFIPSTPAK